MILRPNGKPDAHRSPSFSFSLDHTSCGCCKNCSGRRSGIRSNAVRLDRKPEIALSATRAIATIFARAMWALPEAMAQRRFSGELPAYSSTGEIIRSGSPRRAQNSRGLVHRSQERAPPSVL